MNDWERQHRQAQRYKEAYPPGTRIMLLSMNDPHNPVESGTRGTIEYVTLFGVISSTIVILEISASNFAFAAVFILNCSYIAFLGS